MSDKTEYLCRVVGGSALIGMLKENIGKKYTRTDGKDGTVDFRPVNMEECENMEE